MSSEKISIEVDSRFIGNFFGLVNMPPPEEITLESLNEIVDKIKSRLNEITLSSSSLGLSAMAESHDLPTSIENNESTEDVVRPKTVLIVDDLGIITYQLEMLFKKMGYHVLVSHEINDAIDKFKKQDFGYAIIDLFIPTEREGFILLDELKKLALLCKLNTRLIIMTASSKPEYQTKCLNRGADYYVEKSAGWQKKVIEACLAK